MSAASAELLRRIDEACEQVMASQNATLTAAHLLISRGFAFMQPGQPFHEYYQWRLGELRQQAAAPSTPQAKQPTPEELALIDATVTAVVEAGLAQSDATERRLQAEGSRPFLEPGHQFFDYYKWRLSLEQAAPPAKKSGNVTVTLNADHGRNTPISMGQLMLMLAPLIEAGRRKPGIFLDPNGHVVIPASAFDEPDEQNVY